MPPSNPLLYVLAYALVALWTLRKINGLCYAEDAKLHRAGDRENPASYYENLGLAINAGLFWPLAWMLIGISTLHDKRPDVMHHIFVSEPSRARKERKLAESKARTAELERELAL